MSPHCAEKTVWEVVDGRGILWEDLAGPVSDI